MKDQITLVVRFRVTESAQGHFLAGLNELFAHIQKEKTFVEASVGRDVRDPEIILNVEVWNESPESFMKEQMGRPYRSDFEKMIADQKIERTPAFYSPIASWTK